MSLSLPKHLHYLHYTWWNSVEDSVVFLHMWVPITVFYQLLPFSLQALCVAVTDDAMMFRVMTKLIFATFTSHLVVLNTKLEIVSFSYINICGFWVAIQIWPLRRRSSTENNFVRKSDVSFLRWFVDSFNLSLTVSEFFPKHWFDRYKGAPYSKENNFTRKPDLNFLSVVSRY